MTSLAITAECWKLLVQSQKSLQKLKAVMLMGFQKPLEALRGNLRKIVNASNFEYPLIWVLPTFRNYYVTAQA
jgi:hypothetical protein